MEYIFSLIPDAIAISRAESKQDVLEQLARLFAHAWDLNEASVLERLEERESLGSTGFGRGFAIPHARLAEVNRPIVTLIRLTRPVEFDAADKLPVELVIGLISPENSGATHLHALAAISRLLRDDHVREAINTASDAEAIFGLMTNATDRDAA